MAMQRVDPVFAALARRRPDLSSAHFVICTLSKAQVEHLHAVQGQGLQRSSGELLSAVRPTQALLQSAGLVGHHPDRLNAGFGDTETGPVCLGFSVPKRQLARAVDRNSVRRVAREAWRHAGWTPGQMPAAAMIKLRRAEPAWREIGRPALKKLWREELDQLLARLTRWLSQPGDDSPHAHQGHQGRQAMPT